LTVNIREAVVAELKVLAQPSKQLDYERSLSAAGHAPSELLSVFCDDLYRPKDDTFIASFTSDELRDLAHLYGLIVEASLADFSTVPEMLKDPKWRRVVEVAKGLALRFESAA
jgi:hypothetical protein